MKRLIQEIHRRSVWQVLSIYGASSWAVLGIVDFFTDSAGLPDWTPTMALVIVLLGCPVVLATAAIQGGIRGRAQPWPVESESSGPEEPVTPEEASGPVRRREGIFTWRNAVIGGVAAGGIFLVAVVGYVASWATGLGPVGNLVAQGVLEEGDPILLSDFENQSASTDLARTVTEALRVDLASSGVIRIIEPGQVENILEMMQVDDGLPLQGDRAREVALRGGIKAVIEGTVGSAGEGFILAATIRATDSGETLATFRRTAGDAAEVIEAIDGLSQDIRERAGESLRAIRAGAPLEAVTTSNLEALRLYSDAHRLNEAQEADEAIARAREAIEADSTFAMAYRFLSVLLGNAGLFDEEYSQAAQSAYDLRDRLTPLERSLAEARYHDVVKGDPPAARLAYEAALEINPNDGTALNNLSILHGDFGRWDQAIDLLERATAGPGSSVSAWYNLAQYHAWVGDVESATRTLDEARRRYPTAGAPALNAEYFVWAAAEDWDAASDALDRILASSEFTAATRAYWAEAPAVILPARGRIGEARVVLREEILAARSDEAHRRAFSFQETLFLMEHAFETGRAADVAMDAFRNEFPAGGAVFGDKVGLILGLARSGHVEEGAEVLRALREEWAGTAGEPYGTAFTEAYEYVVAPTADPQATVTALRRISDQVDCPTCFALPIAQALVELGRPLEALPLYAGSFELNPRRRPLRLRETLMSRAQLLEAMGDSAGAIAEYERLAGLLTDPDAEGQQYLDGIRARIEALRP